MLWMHFAVCGVCKQYQQGVEKLERLLKGCPRPEPNDDYVRMMQEVLPQMELSPECRQKMENCLKAELEARGS